MLKKNPKPLLLSRTDFRNSTFERDKFQCVACDLPAVDAHHIIERRLFKATHQKGGYFLNNGSSLCEKHHIEAEQTTLSCQTIRQLCGIEPVILPEHFYPDFEYDKWGNIITPQGRLKGELYYELSVQTTLKNHSFLPYTLAPKPYHWIGSSVPKGNLVLEDESLWEQKEVVVTLQTCGLPFTGYSDYCHGEKLEATLPPAVKTALGDKLTVLDADMRVCGTYLNERLYLTAVWVENDCFDWAETQDYALFLNMPLPPVLWEGIYDKKAIMDAFEKATYSTKIGYEIRLKKGFKAFDWGKSVALFNRMGNVDFGFRNM